MDFVLAVAVDVVVLELPDELPVVVPVVAVPVVEPVVVVAVPVEVVVAALPVVVPVDVVVEVPVRVTDPEPLPVDEETLVDVVDALSLELPPIEPQALKKSAQARDTVRSANTRAPAKLNRFDNIHPKQSS
jgi:hypothetical protein